MNRSSLRKVAIIGASNLVCQSGMEFTKCTCEQLYCLEDHHIFGLPSEVEFKCFACSGARLAHLTVDKTCGSLMSKALNWGANVVFIYPDIVLNSCFSSPYSSTQPVLSPEEAIQELKNLVFSTLGELFFRSISSEYLFFLPSFECCKTFQNIFFSWISPLDI